MRFSCVPVEISLSDAEKLLARLGATEIRTYEKSGVIYYSSSVPINGSGLAMLPGQVTRAPQVVPGPEDVLGSVLYGMTPCLDLTGAHSFHEVLSPPLIGINPRTGKGYNIIIMDSGIRATHEMLAGKVVLAKDFTGEGTVDDIFNHGTSVAFMCAGGLKSFSTPGVDPHMTVHGFAPGASLTNYRIVGASGTGTDEMMVAAIEEANRLWSTTDVDDPLHPWVINVSVGTPDTGPTNPLRVAARALAAQTDISIVAAAGNAGPTPGTITAPAAEKDVVAVGACTLEPQAIWNGSSRGPTIDGLVKPDVSMFGVNLIMASATGDQDYITKTGTSFASPCIAGLVALAYEFVLRSGVFDQQNAQTSQFRPSTAVSDLQHKLNLGVTAILNAEEITLPNGHSFTIVRKPKDAGNVGAQQDNTYGWGVPLLDTAVNEIQAVIQQSGGVDLTSVVTQMIPILGLGLMVPLISSAAKNQS